MSFKDEGTLPETQTKEHHMPAISFFQIQEVRLLRAATHMWLICCPHWQQHTLGTMLSCKPSTWELRQEIHEFETRLDCRPRLCLKNQGVGSIASPPCPICE